MEQRAIQLIADCSSRGFPEAGGIFLVSLRDPKQLRAVVGIPHVRGDSAEGRGAGVELVGDRAILFRFGTHTVRIASLEGTPVAAVHNMCGKQVQLRAPDRHCGGLRWSPHDRAGPAASPGGGP